MELNNTDQQQEIMQKNVAFYQAFLTAWIENRMETDKQLLTLSTLAIGLLMTFHGHLGTVPEFILWISSTVAFITVVIIILRIFQNNSDYIGSFVNSEANPETERLEKGLQKKTVWAFRFFVFGILLAVSLVILKTGFSIVKI